jgi:predicted RNA-binding protein YlxR (DUF448 family)
METIRTCLSCRRKAHKQELCRFVRSLDGEICFDEKAILPDRGAWLCANKICLKKAIEKRILFRGEKTLPINAQNLMGMVSERLKKSTLSNLGFLRRLGQIEAGRDAVRQRISSGQVCVIICSKDLALRSFEEINRMADKKVRVLQAPFLMDEIGESLGRKKTGVVALFESRITDEILLKINKLLEIGQ